MYAAKYLTYMPTQEELRREIEQQKEFFRLQNSWVRAGIGPSEEVQDGEIGREPADAAELVFGEPSGGLVLF